MYVLSAVLSPHATASGLRPPGLARIVPTTVSLKPPPVLINVSQLRAELQAVAHLAELMKAFADAPVPVGTRSPGSNYEATAAG